MKKFLTIFCATLLLSTQSNATGLFIGADVLHSHTLHKADNSSAILGPQDDDKVQGDDAGYSGNFGVRVDPLFLFVSAEVFYDRLNSSTRGFEQNIVGYKPNINIDERYGAKGNVGLTILPWITPFATYGFARVNYQTDVSTHKDAPLYGVGLLIDLPLDITLKAAYDVQKFDITYQNAESKTYLGVARLGLMYNF